MTQWSLRSIVSKHFGGSRAEQREILEVPLKQWGLKNSCWEDESRELTELSDALRASASFAGDLAILPQTAA